MSTRLLLDGEDLPSLMRHVREEFGPGARIVKAERVRTGGVAGFFAKESYELTIEVTEVDPAPARRRPAGRPVGSRPAAAGTTTAPIGIDALIAAAEAADGDGPTPGFTGTVTPPAPVGDEPPPVSTASQTFADVLLRMRQMVGEGEAPDLVVDLPGEAPRDADEADAVDLAGAGLPLSPAGAAVTPGVTATPVTPQVVLPAAPQPGGADVSAMLALGLPAELLSGFSDLTAAVPLSVVTRRIRSAPALVSAPGSVIGVVGEPEEALAAATVFAGRLGLEAREVVLAGSIEAIAGHGRRLLTPSAVARQRARLSPGTVTVVAIGAGTSQTELAAAAELLTALEPTQAWAVVDARVRRIEAVRRLAALGTGREIDALVATGVLEAQAPAAVLSLGLPVGWIGGVPAGSVAWAAVLGERLAEDARWD